MILGKFIENKREEELLLCSKFAKFANGSICNAKDLL